jgi:membrane protease YdiL (CAAX protease family)
MNVAAVPVIGAALLSVVVLLLRTYLPILRSDADIEESIDDAEEFTPQEISRKMVVRFGAITLTIALGTGVGVLVWDLSLSAVGLYGNPLRELAIGFVVAPGFMVVSYYLPDVIRYAGLEFTGKSKEVLTVETRSELGWMLGGVTVQASTEEVFLRAALVGAPAALLSVSAWYFVVPAAVLFGLMHLTGGLAKTLHTSILGVLLGALFVVGGILAVVVVHVLHNQYGVIKYYRSESSPPSSSPGSTLDS